VRLETLLPWAGFGLYLANVALGIGVQAGVVSTRRVAWVHHALYGTVFVAAGVATLALLLAGGSWPPLALTLLALGLMPRHRGGTGPHAALALAGLAGYGLALLPWTS
jgi:hypothetical protein